MLFGFKETYGAGKPIRREKCLFRNQGGIEIEPCTYIKIFDHAAARFYFRGLLYKPLTGDWRLKNRIGKIEFNCGRS